MSREPERASQVAAENPSDGWLVGGGEMAKLIKSKDWSKTPLGPIASWPQSLRTTVSLAQASNSPISIAWGPGNVQIYNDGYWPICGSKHPEAMGQDFRECWASAFPVIGEAYASAWSGKSAYLEKMRMFLDRYGFLEETWFTFSFSPITDESGGIGGLFHPVTEMTSPMLVERRTKTLRDLAQRAGRAKTMEDMFEQANGVFAESDLDLPFVLFYVLDTEGREARLVASNGIAEGTELVPRSVSTSGEGEGPWSIRQVATTGEARRFDDVADRLEGLTVGPYPEVPKTAFTIPILQPGSDRPTAVMVAGASARLRLDESYRGFFDLVAASIANALANARAYEEERKKADALAAIDQAKTAFFSNVSHEFRTPLTLMLGPIEDALSSSTRSLEGESLEMVRRNVVRLMRLVNSLLDFSRIESGRVTASYEPTDLAALTGELASVFRSAIERTGIAFEVDCPSLPEPIHVDHEMWEKIVLNLLSNALKFTFHGSIRVSLRFVGDRAALEVKDTGTGIPTEELPHLFERFHRVHGATSRTHEGSGIGLALVHDLVKLHGGTVSVTSVLGEGTTFVVSIPRGVAHLPPERVVAARASTDVARSAAPFVEEAARWSSGPSSVDAPTEGTSTAQRATRVLVVDDNADLRDYIVKLLRDEFEVETAVDGWDGLAKAKAQRPTLVLSDVMMPRLDGFGLLRELRADPLLAEVPVILLSARAGEESTVDGLDAGADDYLVKPFAARELIARVRTHVELGRQRQAVVRARNSAEAANRELESFSYSVAHDLRAPLRAIDGFSQALLEDHGEALDDVAKTYLGYVRDGAQRMASLIDSLLSLSRVSRAEVHREPMDLGALARTSLGRLQRSEPERKVDVVVEDGIPAEGDPVLLSVAFDNLLGNAWKFTGKKPDARIEFGATRQGDTTVYYVRDNGAGFDMAYENKLFGVFQRLHAASDFEGTGVGLATVQRVIRRHGGRVWADASVGRGATFYFTLHEQEADA